MQIEHFIISCVYILLKHNVSIKSLSKKKALREDIMHLEDPLVNNHSQEREESCSEAQSWNISSSSSKTGENTSTLLQIRRPPLCQLSWTANSTGLRASLGISKAHFCVCLCGS